MAEQQVECDPTVFLGKLAEELSEIGRMLLLQQVDKVRRRTNPLQSLD